MDAEGRGRKGGKGGGAGTEEVTDENGVPEGTNWVEWDVPDDLPVGADYCIRLGTDDETMAAYGQAFTVVDPQPSLRVLTPDGRSQVQRGAHLDIRWTSRGLNERQSMLRMKLIRREPEKQANGAPGWNMQFVCPISLSVPDGAGKRKLDWLVPTSLPTVDGHPVFTTAFEGAGASGGGGGRKGSSASSQVKEQSRIMVDIVPCPESGEAKQLVRHGGVDYEVEWEKGGKGESELPPMAPNGTKTTVGLVSVNSKLGGWVTLTNHQPDRALSGGRTARFRNPERKFQYFIHVASAVDRSISALSAPFALRERCKLAVHSPGSNDPGGYPIVKGHMERVEWSYSGAPCGLEIQLLHGSRLVGTINSKKHPVPALQQYFEWHVGDHMPTGDGFTLRISPPASDPLSRELVAYSLPFRLEEPVPTLEVFAPVHVSETRGRGNRR
jgi:hypothetical protein